MSLEKATRLDHEREPPPRVLYDVPFYPNVRCQYPGDQCLVANIHSVLRHFLPDVPLDRQHVAQLCGYEKRRGAWQTQSLLSLSELGFKTWWVEDSDLQGFVSDPYAFMERCFPDPAALKLQLDNSNIPLEAQRVGTYLSKGLLFEQRKGAVADIKTFLANGCLVRISIDGAALSNPFYYDPHSVLVVGYEEEGAFIHDANSVTGNFRNRFIPWEKLETAWDGFGSTRTLNAFRLE